MAISVGEKHAAEVRQAQDELQQAKHRYAKILGDIAVEGLKSAGIDLPGLNQTIHRAVSDWLMPTEDDL